MNRQQVLKLALAACGLDLRTIASWFGAAATLTPALVRDRSLPVIRLLCAEARNFQSTPRRSDAAHGSQFPEESMFRWCSVAALGICEPAMAVSVDVRS